MMRQDSQEASASSLAIPSALKALLCPSPFWEPSWPIAFLTSIPGRSGVRLTISVLVLWNTAVHQLCSNEGPTDGNPESIAKIGRPDVGHWDFLLCLLYQRGIPEYWIQLVENRLWCCLVRTLSIFLSLLIGDFWPSKNRFMFLSRTAYIACRFLIHATLFSCAACSLREAGIQGPLTQETSSCCLWDDYVALPALKQDKDNASSGFATFRIRRQKGLDLVERFWLNDQEFFQISPRSLVIFLVFCIAFASFSGDALSLNGTFANVGSHFLKNTAFYVTMVFTFVSTGHTRLVTLQSSCLFRSDITSRTGRPPPGPFSQRFWYMLTLCLRRLRKLFQASHRLHAQLWLLCYSLAFQSPWILQVKKQTMTQAKDRQQIRFLRNLLYRLPKLGRSTRRCYTLPPKSDVLISEYFC